MKKISFFMISIPISGMTSRLTARMWATRLPSCWMTGSLFLSKWAPFPVQKIVPIFMALKFLSFVLKWILNWTIYSNFCFVKVETFSKIYSLLFFVVDLVDILSWMKERYKCMSSILWIIHKSINILQFGL